MKKIIYILFLAYSMAFQTHAMEITAEQKTKNSQQLAELFKNANIDSNLPEINALLEHDIDPQFKDQDQCNLLQILFLKNFSYLDDDTCADLTGKLIAKGCNCNVPFPNSTYSLFDLALMGPCLKTSLVFIRNGVIINRTLEEYEEMVKKAAIAAYSKKVEEFLESIREMMPDKSTQNLILPH